MTSAAGLLRRAYQMFARVFPRCSMISQAIAFNLFLAFFPALLIAVALATSRIGGKTSLFDLITDLTQFLPPRRQELRQIGNQIKQTGYRFDAVPASGEPGHRLRIF